MASSTYPKVTSFPIPGPILWSPGIAGFTSNCMCSKLTHYPNYGLTPQTLINKTSGMPSQPEEKKVFLSVSGEEEQSPYRMYGAE